MFILSENEEVIFIRVLMEVQRDDVHLQNKTKKYQISATASLKILLPIKM
jgi:hypothetical protein